jgi:hypothetical protein
MFSSCIREEITQYVTHIDEIKNVLKSFQQMLCYVLNLAF